MSDREAGERSSNSRLPGVPQTAGAALTAAAIAAIRCDFIEFFDGQCPPLIRFLMNAGLNWPRSASARDTWRRLPSKPQTSG